LHGHGLITMRTDRKDQRSKLLRLTEKGEKLVKMAQPCWEAMDRALAHMLYPEEQGLFRALWHFEEQARDKSLRRHVYENFLPKPLDNIEIVPYGIGMKQHFRRLNADWTGGGRAALFGAAEDSAVFDNPRQAIIDKGGAIIFAALDEEIIGTCALLATPESGRFEMAMLGVDPRYRGRGAARIMVRAVINEARDKGAEEIFLFADNTRHALIDMYSSAGLSPAMTEEEEEEGGADDGTVRLVMRL
jgi:ribosomal protein S18 acetylase RimI-like enzyme